MMNYNEKSHVYLSKVEILEGIQHIADHVSNLPHADGQLDDPDRHLRAAPALLGPALLGTAFLGLFCSLS